MHQGQANKGATTTGRGACRPLTGPRTLTSSASDAIGTTRATTATYTLHHAPQGGGGKTLWGGVVEGGNRPETGTGSCQRYPSRPESPWRCSRRRKPLRRRIRDFPGRPAPVARSDSILGAVHKPHQIILLELQVGTLYRPDLSAEGPLTTYHPERGPRRRRASQGCATVMGHEYNHG